VGGEIVGGDDIDVDAVGDGALAVLERGGLPLQRLGQLVVDIAVGVERHRAAGEPCQVVRVVVVAVGVGNEAGGRGWQAGKAVLGRIDVEHLVAEGEREAGVHHRMDADVAAGSCNHVGSILGKAGADGGNGRQGGEPGQNGTTLQFNLPN